MANGPAGMTGPRKAPTRQEIERTYDQALDRFINQNQDRKQEQSSVKSVVADMPAKFQDNFAGVRNFGDMNEAQKAIFRQYDDGRSQYSRDMNRMVQTSPEFAAARIRRFPIETFIERMAPAAVGLMTGTPLGLGALYDETRKLGSATVSGLKKFAQDKGIIPRDNINPDTGTTAVNQDIISPAAQSRIDNQSLMPDIDFLSPQDMGFDAPLGRFVPNPQDMNITAQPGRFVPNPQDMNLQEKMSSQDYFKDLSPAELNFLFRGRNPAGMFGTDYAIPMNQGGLASINNPQYNELMMASDFDI
jgi:hypothetical protein